MRLLFPLGVGLVIGLFGSVIGLNGVGLLVGVLVIIGIINDNLGQAFNVALLSALGAALINGYVMTIIVIGILIALWYHYRPDDLTV